MQIRLVTVLFLAVAMLGLSGCPSSAGKLAGTWEYVEALVPGEDAVDTHFENNGRLRATLVFGEKTDDGLPFSYTEERFLPDREPGRQVDGGAGVNWSWTVVEKVDGFYQTAPFDGRDDSTIWGAWPQLDTELNVAISVWSTFEQERSADEDDYGRNYYSLAETTSNSGPDNPLFWRALVGVTPLDELVVAWGTTEGFSKAEMPDHLNDSIGPVQTYRRVAETD